MRTGGTGWAVASIAALLAVAFCAAARADAGGAEDMPDPRDFTLRLADLDPGYRLGNDHSCNIGYGVWPTDPPDPTYLINECGVGFTRMWMPKGRSFAGSYSVESYA